MEWLLAITILVAGTDGGIGTDATLIYDESNVSK